MSLWYKCRFKPKGYIDGRPVLSDRLEMCLQQIVKETHNPVYKEYWFKNGYVSVYTGNNRVYLVKVSWETGIDEKYRYRFSAWDVKTENELVQLLEEHVIRNGCLVTADTIYQDVYEISSRVE